MSPLVDFLLSHMNRAITSILQSAGSSEKCAQLIYKSDVCYCRPWALGQKPREVCEMFLLKSTNHGFYDSSRGLTRPSSGQTTSLQCCPEAGSHLSCEIISGPVEEDRGWGKCLLVGNGQRSCLVHARRTKGSSSTFKKKGKLPINSTMKDNFTKRFQLMNDLLKIKTI